MASITTKDNLFTNFLFREVATAVAVEVIEVGEEEGEEKDGVEEKDEVEGKDEVEEKVEAMDCLEETQVGATPLALLAPFS